MGRISFIFLKEIMYVYIILYLLLEREKIRIGFFKKTYKSIQILNIFFNLKSGIQWKTFG